MNPLLLAFERASLFGFASLAVALVAQFALDGRVPASWRVWLWRAALLQTGFALIPLGPLHLAVLPARPTATAQLPKIPTLVSSSSPIDSTIHPHIIVGVLTYAPPVVSTQVEAVHPEPPFWPWLLASALYLCGVSVYIVGLMRSSRRVRQRLRESKPVNDDSIGLQLLDSARNIKVSPLPLLLESEGSAPFLAGVFRPVIVLPRSFLSPSNRNLEAVLLHELAHIKRRDLAWNGLTWLVQTLLWFHLLTWVSRRFLPLETESACDEMVLGSKRIAPQFYGELLLNTMKIEETPLAVGVTDGFATLNTRLLRLNRTPGRPCRVFRVSFVGALAMTFAALFPLRFEVRAQNAGVAASAATPVAKGAAGKTPPRKAGSSPKQLLVAKVGIVSGRILTPDNKPVRGARVSWIGYNAEASVAAAGTILATTESDAEGRYRFGNSKSLLERSLHYSGRSLDSPILQLLIEAQGWGAICSKIVKMDADSSTTHVVSARQIKATFLDSDGAPVKGLKVHISALTFGTPSASMKGFNYFLTPTDLKRFSAVTDASGICSFAGLSQGSHARLEVEDDRFAELTYQDSDILLGSKAQAVAPSIHLMAGATVKGRITYGASGLPVAGVRVGAQGVGEVDGWGEAVSDNKGYYKIRNMPPGVFNIALDLKGNLSRDWTARAHEKVSIAVGDEIGSIDFQLEHGSIITGRVVAQDTMQPIEGVSIGMYGPAHPESSAWVQADLTAADGSYKLRVPNGQQIIYLQNDISALGFDKPQNPPASSVPLAQSGAFGNQTFEFSVEDGQNAVINWRLPRIRSKGKVKAKVIN